ncbi:Protein tanc2 [Mactra antiquata]
MSRAFDTFRDLLNDSDVIQYIDTRDSLNGLADIEKGVGEDKQLLNIERNVQQLHAKVNAQGSNIDQCLQTVQDIQKKQEFERNNSAISTLKQLCWRIWKIVVVRYKIISAGWLLLAIFAFMYIKDTQDQGQGCLSEQYHFPVHQNIPLLPYLSDHSSLVGRKWFFEELHISLISKSNDTNTHGFILVAEMGYGKSAIVSELICPTSNKNNVKDIRRHTVGFHICKFDVKATHSVGRFILRLTGFLVMKSDEFGNIISMLSEHSLLHDKDECEKESIACFDQAILHPIKQLKDIPDKPWIFIIDALDECAATVKGDILNLLISRIQLLPWWFKMIITSRNETYLSNFRRMKIQYLKTDDVRNKNDLKTFIDMKLPVSPTKSRLIEDIIEKSDGNFVYVVQAVKWLVTFKNTSAIPELPSDIAHIYEINFDRMFKTAEDYTIPRMILEIICSTINPVSKDDIYTILTGNNVSMNRAEFNGYFHTLSFFLNTDTGVRVKHQALFAWLTSKVSINYQILLERGHSYMSRYLFNNMKLNKRVDLVDLAIHVGNSNDTQLQKVFESSKMINETLINKEKLLHKIIWQTKSVKPLELILSQIDFVDGLNEGNVTAVFVAAAKGNIKQLKLLQRKGADMNFQTDRDFDITTANIPDTLDRMKNVYYSGYSLLHIAAQHGHLNVVKHLLRYNQSMLHIKNSLGMHAGHIACERGHLDVVKTMYEVNSSLFDFDCLYYSSKNDHLEVVKWLVSIGVKYKCIDDSMSSDAINEIMSIHSHSTIRLFDVFTNLSESQNFIKPLDRWWVVFKTDPLFASIRSGSIETALYIAKIFPHSKTCIDAFGFTPALASVVYNRTELFNVLLYHIFK